MKATIRGHGEKARYFLDGQEVTRDEFWARIPPVVCSGDGSGLIGWKPIASDALAVHPRQVEEATASARDRGVPTEFLPDGRPVLTCRSHRKAYLRIYGFHDKEGGYGD